MANAATSGEVTDKGLLLATREIFEWEGYSGTSDRDEPLLVAKALANSKTITKEDKRKRILTAPRNSMRR